MKVLLGFFVVIVLCVAGLLALPFLVDLAPYLDRYKPLVEDALNRKIQLQGIRLTIWPRIGARLSGFSVMDDPAFSAAPFVSLKSLDIGVKIMPLLGGKVEVEEISLRDPIITVVKSKAGVISVSTIGPRTSAPPTAPQPEAPPQRGDPLQALALLAVDRLSIEGGNLTYRDLSTTPPAEYQVQNLELLLQSVHLGDSPSLHVGATILPYNLPVKLDGSFGPLVEKLELRQFRFDAGVGNVTLALKGALLNGMLDVALSSPIVNTADLPVALPLKKPVQAKNLSIIAKAPYPLKQGVSPLELADITNLSMALNMGASTVHVKGAVQNGQGSLTLSSSSINTADLPIAVPLDKPIEITDLAVSAKTRAPLRLDAPPLEIADVPDLRLKVVLGKSTVAIKGTVLKGLANVTLSSPSIHTDDLPVQTGLAKSVEVKNLLMNAEMKDRNARLSDLSFDLLGGRVKGQGDLSLGTDAPPFNGKLKVQGLQVKPALETVSPDSSVSLSGVAAADITMTGRGFSMPDLVKALEGSGHLEMKDGKLEGMNLMGEAVALLKVVGVSLDQAKATAFSTVETDFTVKQGLVNVLKLLMDSHDFQASGKGTIGLDQTLNLGVNLHVSQALSQKIAGSSPVAKLAMKEGRLRLPLLITGTAQNPSYALDMKGLTGKVQEQVKEKATEAVRGLLEGTTKPQDLKQQGKDLLKGLLGR